jgi:acetyl-CoA synthetase
MDEFLVARNLLLDARSEYERAYREFRWPLLNEFNWALDWFDGFLAASAETRDTTALWIVDNKSDTEVRLSFAQLSQRSNAAANFMRSRGISRGDRVLLLLGAEAALWEVMLGCMKLGVVIVPVSTLLTREEVRERILDGGINHVVASSDQAAKVDDDLASLDVRMVVGAQAEGWVEYDLSDADTSFTPDAQTYPYDLLLTYFTSGTTSRPKLVRHTHRSYPVGHLSTMYWIGLQPGDLHLNISSPGWAKHAWSSVFAPWNAGAGVVVLNQDRFNAATLLGEIRRLGITTLCAPPTAWRLVVQEPLGTRPPMLREIVSAGEPLNKELMDQIQHAWGLDIRDGFGQTETTAQIGNSPGQPIKAGSMGRPLPGYKITLLDVEGNVSETEGEVALNCDVDRPAGLMQGYEADGAFVPLPAGYYRTSDIVTRDADGYLNFVGRQDDVFKSSDYRISPFELESALIEHPMIVEAAVVPYPDAQRLFIPKAFVKLTVSEAQDDLIARSIFEAMSHRLAPYKRIRIIEFVDELPKTVSGKIRRSELRARGQATDGGSGGRCFSENVTADQGVEELPRQQRH